MLKFVLVLFLSTGPNSDIISVSENFTTSEECEAMLAHANHQGAVRYNNGGIKIGQVLYGMCLVFDMSKKDKT